MQCILGEGAGQICPHHVRNNLHFCLQVSVVALACVHGQWKQAVMTVVAI